jgi:hypothetical protein
MRGGKRSGSGRKAVKLARTDKKLKRVEAEEILAATDEKQDWIDLLNATEVVSVSVVGGEEGERKQVTVPNHKIRLEARKYLTDRRDGKPAQAVHHSGESGGPVRFTVEVLGASHPASA